MNLPTSSKPNLTPSTTAVHNPVPTAGECGNCGSHDLFPLHNVRLRGIYRRLCTSCVLRLHPSSFCPSCFTLYESNPPPPSKRFSCSKCSSFTHSHCAPPTPSSSSFLCPRCADPNFAFFRLPDTRAIDKKMATVLLCAARIASSSMSKAVVVARAEAERRVREAAVCRKRAREALEHVASVVNKDKVGKSKEVESSVEVSGSGNLRRLEGVSVASADIVRNGNGNENLDNGNNEANDNVASIKEDGIQDKS